MAELFAVSKPNISMLIAKIFAEKELDDSVVKSYLTTAADGKRYNVIYYALEMILAVGFRVRGVRGTQFRQWILWGQTLKTAHFPTVFGVSYENNCQ